MKVLLVTEKCSPQLDQRDGGARIVDTLQRFLKSACDVMQFGSAENMKAKYCYDYPLKEENRFERRLLNRMFVGERVQEVSGDYTHIIFIHISMQFGLEMFPVSKGMIVWTFPMFLAPSYRLSGEEVPDAYFEAEKRALSLSTAILTPSPFEKRQIHQVYGIEEGKVFMVPRGVDCTFLSTQNRKLTAPFRFCSVGSIKPQKNTIGALRVFSFLLKKFPASVFRLIGPIQDHAYASRVLREIKDLGIEAHVEMVGFVKPKDFSKVLEDCHFHLSVSSCETFGRSIFETLAEGIPNVVVQGQHAARDFLRDLPYIAFVSSVEEATQKIEQMTRFYGELSNRSREVGELYDDAFLGRLLVSTLFSEKTLGVCDFDGTLFHKEDEEKTKRSFEAFESFPVRVICSARPLSSLLQEIKKYQIRVDFLIACSGAILADGSGNIRWETPLLAKELAFLGKWEGVFSSNRQKKIQVVVPEKDAPHISFLRKEVYQGKAYFNHWKASKLHALCRLLKEIDWKGRVSVYGDGKYDREMITYFDGQWIHPDPVEIGQQKELRRV